MDGKWVGADRGTSYLSFSVDPGDHSVCADWQSKLKSRSRLAAAVSLAAEPGKVYYYAVIVNVLPNRPYSVFIDAIDPAEANIFLAQWSQSISQPKK